MPEFMILAGLPGSGKSTLAAQLSVEQGLFVVSADRLRLALNAGISPRESDGRFETLNPIVWQLARQAILQLLEAGHSVALDATNLSKVMRIWWIDYARRIKPDTRITIHWCEGDYDSAGRWAAERGYTAEEYRAVLRRLEPSVEVPVVGEADWVFYHGQH